jgi:hypothetical protein
MELSSTHLSEDDIVRILGETLSDGETSLIQTTTTSATEDLSTYEASE